MNASTDNRTGPLSSVKIVEFAGIGPGPFAAMLLASLGADVVRIDRAQDAGKSSGIMARGRRSVTLDLKSPEGLQQALALLDKSDALIEGFRPGVMERLGMGPDVVLKRNPRMVYGRMTGWGQTGPLALAAGHDINYISLSGALASIGTREAPVPPLNVVGDFGGGSMFLIMGLLSGLLSARQTGKGQVVDTSMVEGSALLIDMFYEFKASGAWGARGHNMLDGGAPFYNPYKCADGKWISLGSIEPQFYALLAEKVAPDLKLDLKTQTDQKTWPDMREKMAALFAKRTRAEWCALLEGTDACFAPILDMDEAVKHPHNVERGSFVQIDGQWVPAPAPRFSATPGSVRRAPKTLGEDTASVLSDWGCK